MPGLWHYQSKYNKLLSGTWAQTGKEPNSIDMKWVQFIKKTSDLMTCDIFNKVVDSPQIKANRTLGG